MSTTDPRLSRFGQYQAHQQQAQSEQGPPGLLALSISHYTSVTTRNGNGYHQNGHHHHAKEEPFQFDDSVEESSEDDEEIAGYEDDEIDRLQQFYRNNYNNNNENDGDEDEDEDEEDEIGRRHAAPSKRKIAAAKQRTKSSDSQPSQPNQAGGVFLETDIDTGEIQVRPVQQPERGLARSVGDLQTSPSKNKENGGLINGGRVSPSDRDKSKSVNFGRNGEVADNSLAKRPSVHDMRVDKSLERINVPEWYRDGGDDEEDRRVFRLRSVHDDDGYCDEDNRQARNSAFLRTKSAPPSRKTSTSNAQTTNPIDAIRQSRQWALGRAVGAESRASTTASVASNFRRPSVRYAEKEASLRRPKPIAIRPLEAVVNGGGPPVEPPPPAPAPVVSSQRTVTEREIRTSTYSFSKASEFVSSSGPPPMKQPLHVETRFVDQPPAFRKPETKQFSGSPVHVPIQSQRMASPPGPPVMPKPNRNSRQNSPLGVPVKTTVVSSPPPAPPLVVISPKITSGLLVMEEELRGANVISPQMADEDPCRRPVLLAGYTEAEEFVVADLTSNCDVTAPPQPPISSSSSIPVYQKFVSPRSPPPQMTQTPPPSMNPMIEPTPFVLNNKPFYKHQNGMVPTRSSRVTDIDEPMVSITPPAPPQQVDVIVSPPLTNTTNSVLSPAPLSSGFSPAMRQPSPMSWHTTTVLQAGKPGDLDTEIVIDTAVHVSAKTRSDNNEAMSPLIFEVAPPMVTGEQSLTVNSGGANSTGPPQQQPITRPSTSSSLRASFKKPGKFFAKLWNGKDQKQLPPTETPVDTEAPPSMPPPPPPPPPTEPPPVEEELLPPSRDNNNLMVKDRPVSSGSSLGENNTEFPPPPPEVLVPATSTEKLSSKNGPSRASFRALFWRDKGSSGKKQQQQVPASKSNNALPSDEPVNQSTDFTINESMTISDMSASVISPPEPQPTKPAAQPKKTSVFSPAKWISGRSPAKPATEKTTNGKDSKDDSASKVAPAVNGSMNGNKTQENAPIEPITRPRGNSWRSRDSDAEAMVGDNPSSFKPLKLPEEPPPPQPPPQPPKSAMSNGSKPNHHMSHSSIGGVSAGFHGDSLSRDGRDPDSLSTASSQKRKSRSILQSILHYQEEHDHGPYSHAYVPPPSGETASWLHRRDVPQLVNHTIASNSRPSQPNTPAPGSPTSHRSMTLPPQRQVAPDSFSLHSQNQQSRPDFGTLSVSFQAGAPGASSHSLAKQEQPPPGPYSRQISQASSQVSNNYAVQMAHQQKIRQAMPPPPARLNPAAPPPRPQINVPPPSRPIVDFSPPVTCQRPGCSHTVSAEQARTTFRICESCASAFCSRQCREAHLVGGSVGRKRCPLDNVRDLCQRAAKRLETDRLLVSLLSQFAKMSYLCHGRGYVYAHFSGPERAAAFSNGQVGLHSLALEFHTITHTEAALVRGEPLDEVMDLLQAYNPESKLVLCVGVSVASERAAPRPPSRPSHPLPGGGIGSTANHVNSWDTAALEDLGGPNSESRVVLRAAKLRLAVPRPGSLRALLLVSAGVAFQNRRGNVQRIRELTFSNMQVHLKRRGVDLLASHPNVYTRLTQYVAGTQEFPPTGLCVWDDAVGRSLLALLFPDALPRQDWLRNLHQLGDVEMGLPDPRQLAMGVDV